MSQTESPYFAGPSKDGGKVFKANPRLVSERNSHIIQSNIIFIMLCILALILGVVLCVTSSESNSIQNNAGQVVIIFSIAMMIILGVTGPQTMAEYNRKMSQIYIEVSKDRVRGMTIDKDEHYVYFDVPYSEISHIVYNSKLIVIHLKTGKYLDFDVFYSPREIYQAIAERGGTSLNIGN